LNHRPCRAIRRSLPPIALPIVGGVQFISKYAAADWRRRRLPPKTWSVYLVNRNRAVGLRLCMICLAVAALPVRAAVPSGIDVHGTARIGGHLAPNIVVWLDAPSAPVRPSAGTIVLDQRNLSFNPHVLVVRVGTTVQFPNNDRVFHNVFSFRDGKRFDLGMYPVGALKHVTFDKPGLSRIFCNIHPNMAAYVMAVDTPYFAVSDESGAFNVAAVPPIRSTYHAWRAGAAELSGTWAPELAKLLAIDWP
jgi:plastocyanin